MEMVEEKEEEVKALEEVGQGEKKKIKFDNWDNSQVSYLRIVSLYNAIWIYLKQPH